MIQIEKRILVVNEDIAFCQAFQERMQNSYTVVSCTQLQMKALEIFTKHKWCLFILDIQSSNETRIELLRIICDTKHLPVLTLIPLLKKEEQIALFHAGAVVCLDKATDIEICVEQAKSLIQLYLESNVEQEKTDMINYGTELIISARYRQVIVDGEPLELTRKEFDLLYYLASHPQQVFSLERLYAHVWNEKAPVNGEETVRAHIQNLRRKLTIAGKGSIQNIWGVGYKFVPPE